MKKLKIEDAVKRILAGEDLTVYVPMEVPPDIITLRGMVADGAVFLVDEPEEKPKRKNEIDYGKAQALRDAGWKIEAIAEELKCSTTSIARGTRRPGHGTDND